MLSLMTTLLPEYTRDGSSCPLVSTNLSSSMEGLEYSDSDHHYYYGLLLDHRDHSRLLSLIADTWERLGLKNWRAIQLELT
ncbi:hypothetical protein N7451_009509 [Penicillium sp. IBT 35674x]|nr:hypothetical protein N7451_009509 [Penicillium sp. IBT 35674x]